MSKRKTLAEREVAAYQEGEEAVRRRPMYAPQNPYDADGDEVQVALHNSWDDGAISAGLCDIYTNGVLNKSER